jgi:ABC-2 type transport system permease protein
MSAVSAIALVTLRGLLGRRRIVLLVLLAALPVLVGLAIRLGGGRSDAAEILDTLTIRSVLPLVALVVGTAAIGSEIEDGHLIYLLVKPVARWRVALAKILVAAGLTVVLVLPSVVLTGALVGGLGASSLATTMAFALAATLGGVAYASVFTALGAVTSRALILGLAYTLLWEGVLAGLLVGTRVLSIRQATLGIAAALSGEDVGVDPLSAEGAVTILAVAIVGGFLVTNWALRRFEVRGGD